MLLIALAAAAATAQADASPGTAAVRQATASVRIVSGARISEQEAPETAIVRQVEVEDSGGARTTVRIIEFP